GRRPAKDNSEGSAYDTFLILDICDEKSPLRPDITKDTPQYWAIRMQECWHSDPLKRPNIDNIFWSEGDCSNNIPK
ncbi:2736_t:CDS:2, partial [Gigaspora rosea]